VQQTELHGASESGLPPSESMLPFVVSVLAFFVSISGADLCVNALGVAQRQTTVFVLGVRARVDRAAARGSSLHPSVASRIPSRTAAADGALHVAADEEHAAWSDS
jgi:hypothetical protein